MNIYEHISTTLKSYRARNGTSMKTVADSLNISYQQYAKYENSQNRIPIDKLLTVATLLNINLDELLDIPPWEAIPEECEISKEVRALDEESYQLILALIRKINVKGRV